MTANKKRKMAIRRVATASGHTYQATLRAMQRAPVDTASGRFETIVRETIRLAADYHADRKNSQGGNFVAMDQIEGIQAWLTNPKRLALLSYLDAQNEDDIYKLIAIMYAGRDNDSLPVLGRYVRRAFDTKEIAIVQMMGKAPLAEYLSNGLRAAREQAMSIEAPLRG